MHDISKEKLIPISELSEHIPPGPNGKPRCIDTIRNWYRIGLRGVKLEIAWVGGRTYTSKEAVDRFLARYAEKRKPLPRTRRGSNKPQGVSAARQKRALDIIAALRL